MKSLRTREAKSVLCGALLGDGSINHQRNTTPKCRMHIGHSEDQEEYLRFKTKLIESATQSKFRINPSVDKRNGKLYYHATTTQSKYFWKLRSMFYDSLNAGANRIIPKDFVERYFDEMSLMILILDDGNIDFQSSGLFKQLEIYINSYSIEDAEFFRDFLNEKFSSNFRLVIRNKKYPTLRLTSHNDVNKIVSLIKDGVPECMYYKIYFDCRPISPIASLRHLRSDEHGEYIVRYVVKT